MWKTIRSFPYPKTIESLVLDIADHPHIAVLGAAALCFEGLGIAIEDIYQLE